MSHNDSTARKRYVVKSLTLLVAAILIASPLGAISSIIAPAEAQAQPQLPQLSAAAQQLPKEERNWDYVASGRLGGNYNPQKQITKDNVQYLEVKWVFPIPSSAKIVGEKLVGFANYDEGMKGPALIVDGVVYLILNSKTVFALDAKTGRQLWFAPITASNNNNSIQAGGKFPMTTENAHTHGLNYIDGLLWFVDYGCALTALDAKTGKVARQLKDMCLEIPLDDPRGVGIPTNSGLYGSLQPFPPVIYKGGNSMFYAQGGSSEGTWGGRPYFAAYDFTTGKLKWRTFLAPPCGDPKTCGPGKDGPIFVKEKQEWGQWLVDNCAKIWIQQIKACELDKDMLRNDWGDMRSNSGISNVWMTPLVDEEDGVVYIGTAQPGPDWNATYAPYFRLFGAAVLALNAKTGDIIWAHQTTARDLWDYDCSWNGVLTTTRVKGQNRKVLMKGCKNGIAYVFDTKTGEALHVFEPPSIKRTPHAQFLNPRSKEDMLKPWQNYPSKDAHFQNCTSSGCLESDLTFDPVRNILYFVTFNNPGYQRIVPVENRGNTGRASIPLPSGVVVPRNYTVNAYNVDTGKLVWEYFVAGSAYRGGQMVSGGMVWPTSSDGTFRVLDADSGKVLFSTTQQGNVQPSMGATSDGKMIVLRYIGTGNTPGALAAYGLPDKLPEPQVITKEVIKEVPKEVIKEVPKEVIKEVPKEVIKEVPKEVVKTVTVETVSPISYAAIGVSVVILVVAGVLFSRRKKA